MRASVVIWLSLLTAGPALSGELKIVPRSLTFSTNDATSVSLSRWGDGAQMQRLIDENDLERFSWIDPARSESPLKLRGRSFHTNLICFRTSGVHQIVAVARARSSRTTEFAKALVLVGHAETPVATLGLDLEIVPVNRPMAWKTSASQRFRVLHHGKPLCGHRLLVTNFRRSPEPCCTFATTTDDHGCASVPVRRAGVWVLSVRLAQPISQR